MYEEQLQIFVGYKVEYFDDADLIHWASGFTRKNYDSGVSDNLFEIVRLNSKQAKEVKKAGEIFRRHIEVKWPKFDIGAPESEFYGNRFFRLRLQECVARQCTPWAVCRMIEPIEQAFDFPSWLGNMFNACDWVEPDATWRHPLEHLEDEIKRTLSLPPITMSDGQIESI